MPLKVLEPVADGLQPNSRGCRVPPVALPKDVVLAAGRAMVAGVPAGEIADMLNAIADRIASARPRREAFEASITVRGHAGEFKGLFWSESRRLGRPLTS